MDWTSPAERWHGNTAWSPEGKRRPCKPRTTWRSSAERKRKEIRWHSGCAATTSAKDRHGRRAFLNGFRCPAVALGVLSFLHLDTLSSSFTCLHASSFTFLSFPLMWLCPSTLSWYCRMGLSSLVGEAKGIACDHEKRTRDLDFSSRSSLEHFGFVCRVPTNSGRLHFTVARVLFIYFYFRITVLFKSVSLVYIFKTALNSRLYFI